MTIVVDKISIPRGDVPREWVLSMCIVLILAAAVGGAALLMRQASAFPPSGVSEGVEP